MRENLFDYGNDWHVYDDGDDVLFIQRHSTFNCQFPPYEKGIYSQMTLLSKLPQM